MPYPLLKFVSILVFPVMIQLYHIVFVVMIPLIVLVDLAAAAAAAVHRDRYNCHYHYHYRSRLHPVDLFLHRRYHFFDVLPVKLAFVSPVLHQKF